MNADMRGKTRDELLLSVEVELADSGRSHRVQMRNLSPSGMMAVGAVEVVRGTRLKVRFSGAEGVGGTVAWREGDRFGIAFDREIDPAEVRHIVIDAAAPPSAEG
jgi:hypothetical protein